MIINCLKDSTRSEQQKMKCETDCGQRSVYDESLCLKCTENSK